MFNRTNNKLILMIKLQVLSCLFLQKKIYIYITLYNITINKTNFLNKYIFYMYYISKNITVVCYEQRIETNNDLIKVCWHFC